MKLDFSIGKVGVDVTAKEGVNCLLTKRIHVTVFCGVVSNGIEHLIISVEKASDLYALCHLLSSLADEISRKGLEDGS